MIGAGSPVDVPFLIPVVSAILRATLPGGTDCRALADGSTILGVISGSKSSGLTPFSNSKSALIKLLKSSLFTFFFFVFCYSLYYFHFKIIKFLIFVNYRLCKI